jgi:quercetin dioxygenase-like cupin family protein
MQPIKRRWSKTYEAAEEELLRFLSAKNIHADRIEMSEFETPPNTTTTKNLELWCVEGSLECTVQNSVYRMQAGDYLSIPSGVSVTLAAGFSGCVCYKKEV